MFELIARLVAFFYSLTSSHGISIFLLTMVVMVVVMPLTFKSTKSMIEMRRIQPQIKRLQTKYAADREKMNQELMALYQKHGVNPVGGCLPVLVQAPVFFVLFRVVRGLTRRTVDTGFAAGNTLTQRGMVDAELARGEVQIALADSDRTNFNPEYLDPESDMYQDLVNNNDMVSWGIDLSRSASEVIRESIPASLPFMVLVVLTGVLSWYQQQQIQGRSDAEIPQQMQMITKIMPWMAPLFAFTLPAALGVYFIGSALFRVGQNAVITNRFYKNMDDAPLEFDEDDDEDWEPSEGAQPAVQPGGFLGQLMNPGEKHEYGTGAKKADGRTSSKSSGGSVAGGSGDVRHGSRRPVSGQTSSRNRSRPPRDEAGSNSSASARSASRVPPAKTSGAANNGSENSVQETDQGGSLWARAKRSASAAQTEAKENGGSRDAKRAAKGNARKAARKSSSAPVTADRKPSKRVTPKGGANHNRKK